MRNRTVAVAVVAVVALVVAVAMVGRAGGTDRHLRGMVRTPTPVLELPSLTDAAGRTHPLLPERGRLSLIYFGYTSCPDICPTTLYDLRDALAQLDPDVAARYRLTFVTVDPDRDVPVVVDEYVHSIVEASAGVSIDDPARLAMLADAFGATYSVSSAPDGSVEVSHSAFLYAVDPSGRLLVSWPFGTTRAELAHDLALLAEDLDD